MGAIQGAAGAGGRHVHRDMIFIYLHMFVMYKVVGVYRGKFEFEIKNGIMYVIM